MFGFSWLRLRVSHLAFPLYFFYGCVSGDIEHCLVGPVYCSLDPQVLYLKKKLKMGPMTLFIHLKIILL